MSGEERDPLTDQQRLFQAVMEGRVKKTRIILEASEGRLDGYRNEEGHTLLISSSFIKDPPTRVNMVEMLLDRNPEINRRDLKGQTVLSHASQLGYCDVVNHLVRHRNVDPDAFDFKGNTPLIHAAKGGHTEVLKILTQNFRRLGLKVDHMNVDGFTALLTAAQHGHVDCCRILVHHGRASHTIRDRENNLLPIEWILKHQIDSTAVEFLRPKSRFYRVAKLATSLAKARSVSVFDKEARVKDAQSERAASFARRSDSNEKKKKPTETNRVKLKRQKSGDGQVLSRRRGSTVKAETVQSCHNFSPLLTTKTKDNELGLTGRRKNPPKHGPEPLPKPRRRRSNKIRRSSSTSTQTSTEMEQCVERKILQVDQGTPLGEKAYGMKGIPAAYDNAFGTAAAGRSLENASMLEISWDSVSSMVTSVESLSLSDEDLTRKEESPNEM